MGKKINRKVLLAVLLLVLLVLIALSLLIGSVSLSPREILGVLRGTSDAKSAQIMLYVRMPRVLAAVCAGAGLSVAGAIIQTVLNNSLAGPNIIGVNAGAGFTVVLFGAIFPNSTAAIPAAAFIGALITVVLVYYIAGKTGISKITLVLTGIAINSFLNAASDTVITFVPEALLNSYAFKIGGLSSINTKVLYPAAAAIGLALILAYCQHNEMDVLALGEDTAKSLGLSVSKYRFLLLMTAAILAGASVSFAGLLGFVGLIVPHVARIFVGTEGKYLLPASAIMGAGLLTFCDLLARRLFSPYEISVGIIMSFFGAPFFLYLLMRKKGKSLHD